MDVVRKIVAWSNGRRSAVRDAALIEIATKFAAAEGEFQGIVSDVAAVRLKETRGAQHTNAPSAF